MIARIMTTLILALAITCSDSSASAEDGNKSMTNADRFAFEVLDPSMEFVWRSHRIRQKLLTRLGIPDEMELKTVPERTADFFWARETWNYIGGPELVLYSNDKEWIERISIPRNTQITLPFGLFVGAARSDFMERLDLKDTGDDQSQTIRFDSNLRTTFGHVSISVTIEFDENGDSTQVNWTSYDD